MKSTAGLGFLCARVHSMELPDDADQPLPWKQQLIGCSPISVCKYVLTVSRSRLGLLFY